MVEIYAAKRENRAETGKKGSRAFPETHLGRVCPIPAGGHRGTRGADLRHGSKGGGLGVVCTTRPLPAQQCEGALLPGEAPAGRLAATWRELPECSSSTGAEGLGHRGTSLLVAPRAGDKAGRPTPHGPCLQLCPELARKPVLWYCLKLKLPAGLVVLQGCRAHDSLWHSAEARQGETAALSVSSPARKHRGLCSTWGPAAISPAASPPPFTSLGFKK